MKTVLLILTALSFSLRASASEPAFDKSQLDGVFSGDTTLPLPDEKELPTVADAVVWYNGIEQAKLEAQLLDKHGAKPSGPQVDEIEQALAMLVNTEYGKELCRAVAHGCSEEAFRKYSIVIRVRPMNNVLGQTPAYSIGTKKVITLSTRLFEPGQFKAGDIASVLAHELSHVQDVAKYSSPLMNARLATEKKAYTAALAVFTQLYDSDSDAVSNSRHGLYGMMQAWRCQFDKGPLPDGRIIQGKSYTGQELMDKFFPNVKYGTDFIQAMTRLYYPNVPANGPDAASWAIAADLKAATEKRVNDYGEWRLWHNMFQESYYDETHPYLVPVAAYHPPLGGAYVPVPGEEDTFGQPALPVTPPVVQPVIPPVQPVTPPVVHPVTPPVQPVTPPVVHPVTPPVVHPVTPPVTPSANNDDDDDGNNGNNGGDGGWVDIGPGNPLYPH